MSCGLLGLESLGMFVRKVWNASPDPGSSFAATTHQYSSFVRPSPTSTMTALLTSMDDESKAARRDWTGGVAGTHVIVASILARVLASTLGGVRVVMTGAGDVSGMLHPANASPRTAHMATYILFITRLLWQGRSSNRKTCEIVRCCDQLVRQVSSLTWAAWPLARRSPTHSTPDQSTVFPLISTSVTSARLVCRDWPEKCRRSWLGLPS